MSFLEAIVYGIIQGVTEFLPVSSSAHLVLLPWLFGWKDPGLAFDVALHWGTLFGVLFYFWRDVLDLAKGWIGSLGGKKGPNATLAWQIIIATIPAALIGFFFEEQAETVFRSPLIIAGALAGAGILLYIADRKGNQRISLEHLKWSSAVLIGIFQGLAIIPGISRSGITITIALLLSYNRSSAVRFSFLLSIPIICGAGLLKISYFIQNLGSSVFLIGVLASALSGYIAIAFLVRYVKTKSFTPFVIYRFILAALILGVVVFSS